MDSIDFVNEVKAELKSFNCDESADPSAKRQMVEKALHNVKSRHSEEELAGVFDAQRPLSEQELEQISGGNVGGDIGGFVLGEIGKYVGEGIDDVVDWVGGELKKIF